MANPTYEPKNTALLCVDFYNDFLSEGYGRAGCRDQSFRARRVIGPSSHYALASIRIRAAPSPGARRLCELEEPASTRMRNDQCRPMYAR
jgi:nicotinamidase-related amidase